MSYKTRFAFAIVVAVIAGITSASTPSAVMNPTSTSLTESKMLNLTSASNCAALGYPGAIPHILNGYEKGLGRCCFGIGVIKGGYITMCPENGAKDEWRPCPPGTCNKNNITSKYLTWIDRLSSERVCLASSECTNQEIKKEMDIKRINVTLSMDGNVIGSLVQEKDTAPNMTGSIDLTPGVYTMECTAEGGIPAPQYTITSSGGSLSKGSKATIDLTSDESYVACSVQVSNHFPNHILRFNLHVKSVVDQEPDITCNGVSAVPGDKRAVIDCTVTAPDVTCGKVVWHSGVSGQDFTHKGGKKRRVFISCKSIGQNSIWTQLEVRDLEKNDFEDTFYIKVEGGPGGDYQQGQKINEKSMASNKSNTLTATSTSVLSALYTAFALKLILSIEDG
ncbi:uncharacterized protein LOC110465805 isoform X2 [Mizuhopecten yessoensis]|uniref:uncharacterized protein LOC110465805 isoform X2 n=1 Tax=Mizuhopecten yessoensis TaxID=6573 RepID=UPI000B457705|nr:uncharacterized protein LOC110465805 isoform X2 [Mizuhopecten yessoensis]XP_021377578.1 uncharacterized protein LOC110465805 isoform X2 [Mizuhopecten yessoensis]